ncbi:MAG TPA: hypothetical protein VGF25_02370 [Thermoleophilaceae bacterium]
MSKRPSAVRTETVSPEEPAVPANRTSPPAAATTGVPTGPAMSIPRCCPPAYGSSTFRYEVMTSPWTGQIQSAALADDAKANWVSTAAMVVRASRSMPPP